MKLWIRSQDRKILINCNDIAIRTNSEDGKSIKGYDIVGYLNKTTEYELLGFYLHSERALEVLDEIQGTIVSNIIMFTMSPNVINIKGEEAFGKLFQKMIYEMPKE